MGTGIGRQGEGNGWPITSGMDIALKDRVLSVSSPLCLSDISSEAGLKVRLLLAEVGTASPIRPSRKNYSYSTLPVFTNFYFYFSRTLNFLLDWEMTLLLLFYLNFLAKITSRKPPIRVTLIRNYL